MKSRAIVAFSAIVVTIATSALAQNANQPEQQTLLEPGYDPVQKNTLVDPGFLTSDGFGYRSSREVGFVSFQGMDANVRESLAEDIQVLDHLVRKALPQPGSRSALGVRVVEPAGEDRIQYIDGFGFVMNYYVGIQLLPLAEQTKRTAKESEQSAWDAAKSELQAKGRMMGGLVQTQVSGLGSGMGPPSYRSSLYNKDQVDAITRDLARALAHAGNIRHLKAEDSVLVSVIGPRIRTRRSGEWEQSVLAMQVDGKAFKSFQGEETKTIDIEQVERNLFRINSPSSRRDGDVQVD